MKVAYLKIKNFLSISEVEITLGKVNQIYGLNNQGKTTILKALEAAIRGSTDTSLIKKGETEAEIIVEFDDQTEVRRRIRDSGTQSVKIERKDGMTPDKPQTWLNSLVTESSFNPLELLDPKKRKDALMKCLDLRVTQEWLQENLKGVNIPPVDLKKDGLSVLSDLHSFFYKTRALARQEAEQAAQVHRVKADELAPYLSAAEFTLDEAAVQAQIAEARAVVSENNRRVAALEERNRARGQFEESLKQAERIVADLELKLSSAKAVAQSAAEKLKDWDAQSEGQAPIVEEARLAESKIETLNGQLREFERAKRIQAQIEHVASLEATAAKRKASVDGLDAVVKFLHREGPTQLMAGAKLPLEGLSYDPESAQFSYNGFSLDNLSTSASISLAVKLARELAGAAKIICLDGAEALDSDSYNALINEVKDDGFTYFITRVGDGIVLGEGMKAIQMNGGLAS